MKYSKMLLIRIKYRLHLLFTRLCFKMGFGRLLLKPRYGERILVFHGIDINGETKYNSRFVSKTYFEELIIYLKKNYNIISLEDFYAKKFKPHTLNIAITFDDGYLNNYKYAVPILKEHHIPASFYITTVHEKQPYLWMDFIDLVSYHTTKKEVIFNNKLFKRNTKKEFIHYNIPLKETLKKIPFEKIEAIYSIFKNDWQNIAKQNLEDYWQLMSYTQIQEISEDNLFTIGSHAKTHANLTEIPIENAKQELLNSKKTLEKICNTTITTLAFPFGYYNNKLVDIAYNLGYKNILLVDYNNNSPKIESCKNRFVINPYISLKQQISFLLKGRYY